MKRTAYHEASHLVARMFTDFELSHVKSVSIIPDNKSSGRVGIEQPYSELLLNQVPVQMQSSNDIVSVANTLGFNDKASHSYIQGDCPRHGIPTWQQFINVIYDEGESADIRIILYGEDYSGHRQLYVFHYMRQYLFIFPFCYISRF